jgi:hypothetical protein
MVKWGFWAPWQDGCAYTTLALLPQNGSQNKFQVRDNPGTITRRRRKLAAEGASAICSRLDGRVVSDHLDGPLHLLSRMCVPGRDPAKRTTMPSCQEPAAFRFAKSLRFICGFWLNLWFPIDMFWVAGGLNLSSLPPLQIKPL